VKGYNKMLARVNLSQRSVSYEKIDEELLLNFVGGKGLVYYYLYREVPPSTKPLSPSNKLLFAPGAFSGLLPGGSKVAVAAISPETGLINDSYAGDRFGPFLKRAGFDLLIIEGRSEEPVYIVIENGKVEIKDAEELWGMGVYELTEYLWQVEGASAIAAIGPGGEKLVRFASIIFDEERAAGRGGLGAVMGSKNLKAVVVKKSDRRVEIYDEEKFSRMREKYYDKYASEPSLQELRDYGTTNGILGLSSKGMSPAYNFKRPYIEKELAEKLSGKIIKKYEIEPREYIHGSSCPVKCARYVKVKYGDGEFYVKPEYESLAMLGASTGVFDFEKVAYFIHLSNDLGIDTIAAGNVIAWLFELVEKGLIGEDEIGFPVKGFGDHKAEEKLLRLIGERRGIGAILAEGVKRASELIDRGKEFAVHVKGLESPAWDPRGRRTYALSYATGDIGASHLRGWPFPHSLPSDGPARELVPSLIESRDKDALFDSLGVCKFIPYSMEELKSSYEIITGVGSDALEKIGWRVETLARIYNIMGGLTPLEEDVIPPRWWEKEEEGPAKGNAAFQSYDDFLDARRHFYSLRGWDELGVPLPETLEKLGLGDFIEDTKRAREIVLRRIFKYSEK